MQKALIDNGNGGHDSIDLNLDELPRILIHKRIMHVLINNCIYVRADGYNTETGNYISENGTTTKKA